MTITPEMLTFLGPRMQMVYNAVTALNHDTLGAAWPLAEQALSLQGIETSDLSFPKSNAGVRQFTNSILARAKPSFTQSLKRIAHGVHLADQPDQRAGLQREMIEVGALLTYAESGLVEQSAVMAIQNIMNSQSANRPNPVERETSLSKFIHVKSEDWDETETEIIRMINFDDLFSLVSIFSKQNGMTRHEFSGYGITPIMMREARAGDETGRDWREILVQLEDDINPNGIPYRDGIMQGNSYNQRMSPKQVLYQISAYVEQGMIKRTAETPVTDQLAEAIVYFENTGRRIDKPKGVETIDSDGNITFGMALVEEKGVRRIIVETGFLDLVESRGNPHHMLERAFVYLLNEGTHEANRIMEFEYAKARFRDRGYRVGDEIRVDVEQVYANLVNRSLTNSEGRNEQLANEWTRKVKEPLWEIGVHMLNGDMSGHLDKPPRIRWTDDDQEFTDKENTADVTIGIYASALNPLHFGQFEPVLRAMAQLKIDIVGVVNHAFDYRKQGRGLNPTFAERNEMAEEWVKQFGGLLTLAKTLDGSEADGETKFKRLIEINGGRRGKTTFVYTAVGGDHMHIFAPSTNMDDKGYRLPQMDGDHYRPDTVKKMDDMRNELAEHMNRNRMNMVVAFNFRELNESLPMPVELNPPEGKGMRDYMEEGFIRPLGHINLFGTSSTNIRLHFSGDKTKDITHLPVHVARYIEENGRYRGWIVGLPHAIKRIATTANPNRDDIQLLKSWLNTERANGKEPTAEQLARDFSFSEEQLRKFNFVFGSQLIKTISDPLVAAEQATGVSFKGDLIEIAQEQAAKAMRLADQLSHFR